MEVHPVLAVWALTVEVNARRVTVIAPPNISAVVAEPLQTFGLRVEPFVNVLVRAEIGPCTHLHYFFPFFL
ncbi:MAG TPA: hypothetical protein PK852_02530 [Mesotoga prima]|uniref:hypothetical protein n=1 Tax=Mesotoga prima TaxID=1184387 RepID=UPI002C3F3017|nr:hypothetical protein [Mesotoga prima]HPE52971.1 hypothetical protein [Mesotoga prima]